MAGTISAGDRPAAAALARLGRVHGRELRRASARHDARRHPRLDDRRAPDALDRDGRRAARARVPAPVADPARCATCRRRRPNEPAIRSRSSTSGSTAPEMALATATPDGRPSVRMVLLKSADERGFAFFTELRVAQGRRARGEPARRAALPPAGHPGARRRAASSASRAEESDAYWATRPERVAAQRRCIAAVAADRLARGARGGGRRAARASRRGPQRWGGYRLVPDTYEFWRHRDDRLHERHLIRARGDGWDVVMLQP